MAGYESSLCGKQVWIKNTGAFDADVADQGQGSTIIATVRPSKCPMTAFPANPLTNHDRWAIPARMAQPRVEVVRWMTSVSYLLSRFPVQMQHAVEHTMTH